MLLLLGLLLLAAPQVQAPTTPSMVVTPSTTQSSSGDAGGPFSPTFVSYVVKNEGLGQMYWSVSSSANWITLSPSGGVLGKGRTATVQAIFDADALALALGTHTSTLTFANTTNGVGNTTRSVELNVAAPGLTPGGGWGGATAEPGQIGSGTAKCIARWDVVPYQTVTEATTPTFAVGVVAFHIAGIEKVSFGVEGGSFVDVTDMSYNARTGVWEYCATLDVSDFTADGVVELRAIAYPNAAAPPAEGTNGYAGGGYPRLLESMYLYLDVDTAQTPNVAYCAPWGSDSTGTGSSSSPVATPFKAAQVIHAAGGGNASNGTVLMMAGDYEWSSAGGGTTPATPDAFLTFRPAPGATPDQVRITTKAGTLGMSISKVHLKSLRLHTSIDGNSGGTDKAWLEDVGMSGIDDNDPTTLVSNQGWLINWNGGTYLTDCFGGNEGSTLPAGVHLARNCHYDNVIWMCNNPKLIVNCSWRNLGAHGSTVHHPDFIHWNFLDAPGAPYTADNAIIYGVNGHVIDGSGFFLKTTAHIRNVAIVNVAFEHAPSGQGDEFGHDCVDLDHLLLWHVTANGAAQWWYTEGGPISMTNCSFIGTRWWGLGIDASAAVYGMTSGSWDYTSITAHPSNGWNGYESPGTHLQVDIDTGLMLDSELIPQAGSPLKGKVTRELVPVDAGNVVRTYPTSIGAYE